MNIKQVLNKYRDKIKDVSIDDETYFIELKKPYANNEDAPTYITDLIVADSAEKMLYYFKRCLVKLKPDDWDKMYNEDFKNMSDDPYDK